MFKILSCILSILFSILAGCYFFKSGCSENRGKFFEDLYAAILFELFFIISLLYSVL